MLCFCVILHVAYIILAHEPRLPCCGMGWPEAQGLHCLFMHPFTLLPLQLQFASGRLGCEWSNMTPYALYSQAMHWRMVYAKLHLLQHACTNITHCLHGVRGTFWLTVCSSPATLQATSGGVPLLHVVSPTDGLNSLCSARVLLLVCTPSQKQEDCT